MFSRDDRSIVLDQVVGDSEARVLPDRVLPKMHTANAVCDGAVSQGHSHLKRETTIRRCSASEGAEPRDDYSKTGRKNELS